MSTNNEVIIIAEESTGETTVVEIIATDSQTLLAKDADGETLVEEIVEAVFDHLDETDDGDERAKEPQPPKVQPRTGPAVPPDHDAQDDDRERGTDDLPHRPVARMEIHRRE